MERELARMVLGILDQVTAKSLINKRDSYSHAHLARVLLWSALHERPISWACRPGNWSDTLRPTQLPYPSTMSRRMRRADFQEFLRRVHRKVHVNMRRCWLHIVDGKPLLVSENSRDPDARVGRGVGRFGRSYKLHAITDKTGLIRDWRITSLNINDPREGMGHPVLCHCSL